MTIPLQIILVEDNDEYREVLRLAISREDGIALAGAYSTAEIALRDLEKADAPPCDIVLLDLRLPQMSGLDALPRILAVSPESKVIVLSQSRQEADVVNAISLGASGYLLKSSSASQIKDGIRRVASGGAILDSHVANYILEAFRAKEVDISESLHLSEREVEVLKLLAKGQAKKEIADSLSIAYDTVDSHVRRIYRKLDVRNAPAAVTAAFRAGLLKADDPRG